MQIKLQFKMKSQSTYFKISCVINIFFLVSSVLLFVLTHIRTLIDELVSTEVGICLLCLAEISVNGPYQLYFLCQYTSLQLMISVLYYSFPQDSSDIASEKREETWLDKSFAYLFRQIFVKKPFRDILLLFKISRYQDIMWSFCGRIWMFSWVQVPLKSALFPLSPSCKLSLLFSSYLSCFLAHYTQPQFFIKKDMKRDFQRGYFHTTFLLYFLSSNLLNIF